MDFYGLKDFMDRLTAWRIPGNEISVCIKNEEVFRYTSGYSDYENKIPMEARHWLFNIYSASKVATVTGAMKLYEQGRFLLDDPLYDFISEFRDIYVHKPDGSVEKAKNPITLRQLFTMTSGITYNTDTQGLKNAHERTNGNLNTLEVAKGIAEDGVAFEPGTDWKYGLNHDVLAAVVEVVSGMKFSDYMKENIFEPLGMDETCYHNEGVLDKVCEQYRYVNSNVTNIVDLQNSAHNKADGYIINVGKKVHSSIANNWGMGDMDSGGSGITTSVSDYSKLCGALANGGVGANKERIIAKSTIDLMRTNQLTDEHKKNFRSPQHKGYGYGLGVRTMMDRALSGSPGSYGEFGWAGAAGAAVICDPELNLSVFYAHHMLNPQESYYLPRLRNVIYTCLNS